MVTSGIGNFQVKLAYRTAASMQDVPSVWSPLGAFTGLNGTPPEEGLSLGSSMYVQFGLGYSVSSGTAGSGVVSVVAGVRRA
jgi:hypothetical protein